MAATGSLPHVPLRRSSSGIGSMPTSANDDDKNVSLKMAARGANGPSSVPHGGMVPPAPADAEPNPGATTVAVPADPDAAGAGAGPDHDPAPTLAAATAAADAPGSTSSESSSQDGLLGTVPPAGAVWCTTDKPTAGARDSASTFRGGCLALNPLAT